MLSDIKRPLPAWLLAVALTASDCGSGGGETDTAKRPSGKLDRVVKVDGDRGLYVRWVAGIVLVETGPPFKNPPKEIVEATDPSNSENVEHRDYLQVEKDGWAARKRIGDIPVSVISNRFSKAEIAAAEYPEERPGMRTNVEAQKGWLVLSPGAKQVVVTTGHAVEERDPQLEINQILAVVKEARK